MSNLKSKRSFTGNHALLPAIRPAVKLADTVQQPAYSLLAWTLGRGSVIWRIWPAVLLHTLFAAAIVSAYEEGPDWVKNIAIPNVMLTVLGVVIGFVISYRAMSGYDRYWMGRTTWSDVIRNTRTMGRLIWFHVPPQVTPKTAEEKASGTLNRSTNELLKVMAEKRMALDLVAGFAIALKHHIRGETGIYFEDLYDLVRPLHDHDHTVEQKANYASGVSPPPGRAHRIASNPGLPTASNGSGSATHTLKRFFGSDDDAKKTPPPPATAYGTFEGQPSPSIRQAPSQASLRHALRRSPSQSSQISSHQPLQASQQPGENGVMDQVSGDLIPFAGMFGSLTRWFRGKKGYTAINGEVPRKDPLGAGASQRKWGAPLQPRIGNSKHRVMPTTNGENLPLEILRCLSEWCSVIEDRGTSQSVGSMIGTISAMEETLSSLERILTTPLPFVYSVHIRHTVWVYLFFLPFQLVAEFGWHTIPGVTLAAFIYLGFLAAGEEIEQPFGYDENDLDLDMFCQEVINVEIENLKKSPCLNAYLPPKEHKLIRHRSMTLTEATANESGSESD